MDLPSDLLYFVSQIQNYSKNTVKLQTLNQNSLGTNGQATQMRLSLPVSSIVNLKSLSMHCEMQTYGLNRSAGGTNDAVFALIPRGGIAAVLDRVSWMAGGIALDSGPSNYGLQYTVKSNLEKSADKYMSDDRVLAQSTIESAGAYDAASASPAGVSKQLVQNNFLGFTEAEPCYMDMSLLPECFMTLQISDSSAIPVQFEGTTLGTVTPALVNSGWSGSQARFELKDIFFTCEVVSVSNGLYSVLTERMLAEKGSIDVPYKSYQIFSVDTPSAAVSLRGSVSTMSLDRCYGFFRNGAPRGDTNAPVPAQDQWWYQQPPLACTDNTSFAFQQASVNLLSNGIQDWTFRINNSPYPLYRPDRVDAFNYVVCGHDRTYSKSRGCLVGSQSVWKDNCWCAMVQLAHNDDTRSVSGIDLRSINSQINFDISAGGGSVAGHPQGAARQAFLMTESTSMLRIGDQRSLAVIA